MLEEEAIKRMTILRGLQFDLEIFDLCLHQLAAMLDIPMRVTD